MTTGQVLILCHADSVCTTASAVEASGGRVVRQYSLVGGVSARVTPESLIRLLREHPHLDVRPDRRFMLPPNPLRGEARQAGSGLAPALHGANATPERPGLSPLALDLMEVAAAHALQIDGSGVRVAIIDSGVDFSHPDLQGTGALDEEGQLLSVDFTGTDLTDTLGHGTAVAGMVAAQGRRVYQVAPAGRPPAYTRIRGVAPGARLLSAKVFDTRVPDGGGWESSIIAALEWAANNGAQVVNMSLGGGVVPNDGRDPLCLAVAALRERGVLVLSAAGNEGTGAGTVSSPGSSPATFTVGASTAYRSFGEIGYLTSPGRYATEQVAGFSSMGPTADGRLKPDALAPGAFCWSLAPAAGAEEGTMFQLFGGTSQATPLAAGVAALVLAAFYRQTGRYPTPAETESILLSGADDLGFPANAQGAGRLNARRSVELALGRGSAVQVGAVTGNSGLLEPGGRRRVEVRLHNPGQEPATVTARAVRRAEQKPLARVVGQLSGEQPVQDLEVMVPEGCDFLHVLLNWTGTGTEPDSPRAVVALYDPDQNFVNYQRAAVMGDPEWARSVETWAARPRPGRWTVRVQMRSSDGQGRLPYTLTVRRFQWEPWDWVPKAAAVQIQPGGSETLALELAAPAGAAPGLYEGRLELVQEDRRLAIPLGAHLPIQLEPGTEARFAGLFHHGFRGRWHEGDWHYQWFRVPAGAGSLSASIFWPDPGNSLEFYLIDPGGRAVLGKSAGNGAEPWAVQGHELVISRPEAGLWQAIVHGRAFSGRGDPEPYTGTIRLGPALAEPRQIRLTVSPGERVPLTVGVRHPGRVPLRARVVAISSELGLQIRPVSTRIETGVEGRPVPGGGGRSVSYLGPFRVAPGARLLGLYLTWQEPGAEVAVALIDSISGATRAMSRSREGMAFVLLETPAPGDWLAQVSVAFPGNPAAVEFTGGWLAYGPQELAGARGEATVLLPGAETALTCWVTLDGTGARQGELLVLSDQGDQLAAVPFRLSTGRSGRRRRGQDPS